MLRHLDNNFVLSFVDFCNPCIHFVVHLGGTRLELCELFVDFLDVSVDLFTLVFSGKIEIPPELLKLTLPCAKFFFC